MADYYYNPGNALKGIAAASNAVAGVGLANAGYDLADMRTKWETAGNRIFLRRGSIQQINSLYFNSGLVLGNGNGITVRLYGDDDADSAYVSMLWYITPTDSAWTYIGSGQWTYTLPNSSSGTGSPYDVYTIFRGVQFGDYQSKFLGNATARCASVGSVTTDSRFHWVDGVADTTGAVLTMYTGSAVIHPGTYFGGLALVVNNGYGAANGWWQQNAKHCSVEGIAQFGAQMRFAPTHTGGYAGSNEDNEYIDCKWFAGYNGLLIYNLNSAVANRRLTFHRFIGDTLSGPEGNTIGYSEDEIATENCVSIQGYAEAIKFVDLEVNAARHTCVQFVPDSARAPDLTYPRGISIDGLKCDIRHGSYGRAIGANCDGWSITNATITNSVIQSQLGGIGHLSRFTWDCVPLSTASATNGGNDLALFIGLNGSGGTLNTVKNVKVSFGVIRNSPNYTFRISAFSTGTLTTPVIELSNLTIYEDPTYFVDRKAFNGNTASPSALPNGSIFMNNSTGSALDPQVVKNCCFIVPSGQTGNITVFDSDTSSGQTLTQYGANGLSGHTGNVAYTSLSAAGLDENLRPVEGSALLEAGNVTASGHRDADNFAIPVGVNLPIGAYAAKPLRALVTLP